MKFLKFFGKGSKPLEEPKTIKTPELFRGSKVINPHLCSESTTESLKDHTTKETILNGSVDDKSEKKPSFVFKSRVSKKLFIILVENTEKIEEIKQRIYKLINLIVGSEMMYIITYGTEIRKSEILDVFTFKDTNIFNEDIGENVRLYDALISLKDLLNSSKIETETEIITFEEIAIIGVGTCSDNCSEASKDEAIDCFSKLIDSPKVISKYYCLTEDGFLNAAEIGFRAIGSISQKY